MLPLWYVQMRSDALCKTVQVSIRLAQEKQPMYFTAHFNTLIDNVNCNTLCNVFEE